MVLTVIFLPAVPCCLFIGLVDDLGLHDSAAQPLSPRRSRSRISSMRRSASDLSTGS
jgi:hypothetical protein